jgi:hypothetical protein
VVVAALALLVVVVARVTMERAASALGTRFAVPEIVVGGLVLAAVTSLPNAVAAVYLAARGRGAATLSIALNSNTLNVVFGLLLPAAVIGLGRPTGQATLIAAWYLGLTAVLLAFAWRDHGVRRKTGILVIAAYAVFTGSVLVTAHTPDRWRTAIAAGAVAAVVSGVWLVSGRRQGSGGSPAGPACPLPSAAEPADQLRGSSAGMPGNGRSPASGHSQISDKSRLRLESKSLVSGWPVRKLWFLGLAISIAIAVIDAVLGHRVILIGLLIAGPCLVLLTGRWVPTGLTGLWVIGLAVVLGVPDGIWGTGTHLVFLAAVAAVALVSTLAAAVIEIRTPPIGPL